MTFVTRRALGAAAFGFALMLGGAIAPGAARAQAAEQDLPVLTIATLEGGTVTWELDTIRHYGLDTANGFRLEVLPVAGKSASAIALQGGAADAIVTDWFWVARMRAEGSDYRFIPYSRSVGGLLAGDGITGLADLKGRKIGIAGGPLDKSWLILRAYARQELGMDLAAETEQVFGAPPLIMQAALKGEVDAALNFWHFAAKMEAGGLHVVTPVAEAAQALGLDPDTPLLGYVINGALAEDHPDRVAGLIAASRAAKERLLTDPEAFDRLRETMRAGTDAEFEALKAGWAAGNPADAPVDLEAADRMLRLMAELGGEELLGKVDSLPEGTFLGN